MTILDYLDLAAGLTLLLFIVVGLVFVLWTKTNLKRWLAYIFLDETIKDSDVLCPLCSGEAVMIIKNEPFIDRAVEVKFYRCSFCKEEFENLHACGDHYE
jgi:DNA-directed RNA polymerase subunit RPC12/RpoP